MKHPRIDWTKQPFGVERIRDIALATGVGTGSVCKGLVKFRKWYARHPVQCPDCTADVDIETYLELPNRKKQCRSCWCGWNAPYDSPGVGVQRNMSGGGWASDGLY